MRTNLCGVRDRSWAPSCAQRPGYNGRCTRGLCPASGLGISFTRPHRTQLNKEELPASSPSDPGPALLCCGARSLSLPPEGFTPTGSINGAVGWGLVCFLLFAKGSHSLSSALVYNWFGKTPASAPHSARRVPSDTLYCWLPAAPCPLPAVARCALSCPCRRGAGWLCCGGSGMRGQGP